MTVRTVRVDDELAVRRVLDAAVLEYSDLGDAIEGRRVLVAEKDDLVTGALVFSRTDRGLHVEAIAVRRSRRDRGVGTVLVEAALDRLEPDERLTADFDASVRPFYESLDFEIRERVGRLHGVRERE